MRLKVLLNKFEDTSYVLKDENGNEIDFETSSTKVKNSLLEKNVISSTIEKDYLVITIELPKPKEKITYTPKFQIGEFVYKCVVDNIIMYDNSIYFKIDEQKIAITKINEIKITNDSVLYRIDGFSYDYEEKDLFKTKEELLNAIVNQIKNSVDKLDDLE